MEYKDRITIEPGKKGGNLLRERRQEIEDFLENRCGVCGFDVQLLGATVGIDAAHVRWKQARGPDVPANGIALWALHHRRFDRGAFTLLSRTGRSADDALRLVVSEQTTGEAGLHASLLTFHGRPLKTLPRPDQRPATQHLEWHRSQVFRAPGRG